MSLYGRTQTKNPSGRKRQGALYDIVGKFDPDLWKGTDELVKDVEDYTGKEAESAIASGSLVTHPVFGKGVVVDEDPETGTVRVKFESFGERRISAASLQEDDG